MSSLKTAVFIFLVFLLGFYLRISGVLSLSFAYTYDVGRDMLELQKISQLDIPLIGPTTGLAGLYYGPWWYYILTPAYLLSGGNPQGVAVFMVFTGLLSIGLGYILGKIISGRILGLFISSFISFSTVMIGFSNQIWNPNIIPPLVLVALILLVKINGKKDYLKNILLGFVLGLILDSEIVFGVLFLTGVLVSFLFLFRKKLLNFGSLFILFGFLFILLPRVFFEVRHQFVMTKSFLIDKGVDQKIFDYQNFFSVFPERISTYISQFAETFGVSFIIALLIIFLIALIWFLYKEKAQKKEIILLNTCLIILITFLAGSSFFARSLWGHYIVGLPVLYITVVSLTLVLIARKSKYISVALFLLLLAASLRPYEILRNITNPYWEGDAAVYRNQVAVMDYVYKSAKGRKFNYIVYTPVVHDYTYQYLFRWYGNGKYKYVPSTKTEDLLFMIIEPDPGYNLRLADWIKSREGDGKTIKSEVVKGGIEVQTRIR